VWPILEARTKQVSDKLLLSIIVHTNIRSRIRTCALAFNIEMAASKASWLLAEIYLVYLFISWFIRTIFYHAPPPTA